MTQRWAVYNDNLRYKIEHHMGWLTPSCIDYYLIIFYYLYHILSYSPGPLFLEDDASMCRAKLSTDVSREFCRDNPCQEEELFGDSDAEVVQ